MAVTLKTLVDISPFDTAVRNQLLDKLDTLTPDQQYRLSSACWTALSAKFQAQLKARTNQALLEVMEGKKKYTKEDFLNIENSLYTEFANLLQSAQTEEEVGQVRQELQKYITTPTAQVAKPAQPVPPPITSQPQVSEER